MEILLASQDLTLQDLFGDAESRAAQNLRAVLTIPEELGGKIEISAEDALFVLWPGSLEAVIGWKGAYAANKWLIGFCLRRGRVPSQIADDIVKGLRDRTGGLTSQACRRILYS